MADQSQPILCGVDVAKDSLDIAQAGQSAVCIPNTVQTIQQWLDSLPGKARIAMEATGRYHLALQEQATRCGHRVYLVNGKQLRHYREAVGVRAKTDPGDARLLLRYLQHEQNSLSPAKVLSAKEKQIWSLLQRRATLVKARNQLNQSLGSDPQTLALARSIGKVLNGSIARVDRRMLTLARRLGWAEAIKRCQGIPGIGPLNALALVVCFNRGDFRRADQFVAYLGLDVRVRDSGTCKGKRKLTKRGNAEMRRLLYNAAMSFARNPTYRPWYERYTARGLSSTAALMIVARKLVRIAFALLSKGEEFEVERFGGACVAT